MSSPQSHKMLYLAPILLGAYLTIYFFVGERAPYNDGLGFDGYFYGQLARDVPKILSEHIPEYYLDRILPSVVVWLASHMIGATLSRPDQIVSAFHIYNSLLLVGAACLWVRLSRVLEFSTEVAVIGAACLFLNWIVIKQYLYFVVQTDTTAFAAGILVSLCVIERRPYLLAVTALLASFAFKTIMPMAMLPIVFPTPAPERQPSWFDSGLALVLSALAATLAVYALFWERLTVRAGGAQVDMNSLWLSIPILAAYVWYVARSIPAMRIFASLQIRDLGSISFFFALWIARAAILALMFSRFANNVVILDMKSFFLGSVVVAVAKPAVFLIAHIVSFGPSFVLLLLYLRRIFEVAASRSNGAALFIAASLALSVVSESRILAFAYPMLITSLCVVLNNADLSRRFTWLFLGCSFVISRWYLPLNALGMGALPHGSLTDVKMLLQFPSQWFFMMIGPYMGWIGYWVNLGLSLFASFAMLGVGIKMRTRKLYSAQ